MDDGSNWAQAMHALLLEQLSQPELSEPLLRERYRAILRQAEKEEPLPQKSPRGKPKCTVGRNLLKRLQQHEDAVLLFAFNPQVPFTNNQAERDLRPAKVNRTRARAKSERVFSYGDGSTYFCALTSTHLNLPQTATECV